jgi:hypothetical protein
MIETAKPVLTEETMNDKKIKLWYPIYVETISFRG